MEFSLNAAQLARLGQCRELARDFGRRSARHNAKALFPAGNDAPLRHAGLFGLLVLKSAGGIRLKAARPVATWRQEIRA